MIELREKEEGQNRIETSAERTDSKPVIIPFKWLPNVYRNMFNFAGRTGQIQFWVDMLVLVATVIVYVFVMALLKLDVSTNNAFLTLFTFILLLSINASAARRFRDAGYPAWSILLILVPIAGIPWVIYRLCQASDHDKYQKTQVWYNKYAEDYYVDKK